MRHHAMTLLMIGALGSACAATEDGDDVACADGAACATAAAARRLSPPQRIQAGDDLVLLAVTDDDHALYQDGQTVYATRLRAGAPRTVVAEVPGTNLAFPLQVGRVVFLWTDPQRNLPGFGVSPLVLWTAADGPRQISAQSSVGLVATAASPDSRELVFTTNVTDDGARGDLAYARTANATAPTLLLRDIPMGFPNGRCRPLAGFGGDRGHTFPVAAYCAGDDVTATLSRWDRGVRRDLIAGIATPLPFTLEADPRGTTFLVNLADDRVATVTADGEVAIVDAARSRTGFVTRHGDVVYAARTAAGAELRIALDGEDPRAVAPVVALYAGLYNRAGYFRSRTASPDGRAALFATTFDPATGLTDMHLLDTRTGDTAVLTTETTATIGSELFTADADHALYFTDVDLNAGTGRLVAGDADGIRPITGDASAFDVLQGAGSAISFTTNPSFDPRRSFLLSTGDLLVADVDHPARAPRLVAAQANLFYLPTGDRRRLVFASQLEANGPGLYLASGEP